MDRNRRQKEKLQKISDNLPSAYVQTIIDRLAAKGITCSGSLIMKVLYGERTNYKVLNELSILASEHKKEKDNISKQIKNL